MEKLNLCSLTQVWKWNLVEIESFNKFWNDMIGHNIQFCLFFWLKAISYLTFDQRHIVFMESFQTSFRFQQDALEKFSFSICHLVQVKNQLGYLIKSSSFLQLRASSCWVFSHLHIAALNNMQMADNKRFGHYMLTWNKFNFFWLYGTNCSEKIKIW